MTKKLCSTFLGVCLALTLFANIASAASIQNIQSVSCLRVPPAVKASANKQKDVPVISALLISADPSGSGERDITVFYENQKPGVYERRCLEMNGATGGRVLQCKLPEAAATVELALSNAGAARAVFLESGVRFPCTTM